MRERLIIKNMSLQNAKKNTNGFQNLKPNMNAFNAAAAARLTSLWKYDCIFCLIQILLLFFYSLFKI